MGQPTSEPDQLSSHELGKLGGMLVCSSCRAWLGCSQSTHSIRGTWDTAVDCVLVFDDEADQVGLDSGSVVHYGMEYGGE